MTKFYFRGNNRHIIILPKSAPTPAGFTLASCEGQGTAGQLVREISPHLAQNVHALQHACTLLHGIGVSVAASAREVAPKLSDGLSRGLLCLYVEQEKPYLHGGEQSSNSNSDGGAEARNTGGSQQQKTLPQSRGQLDEHSTQTGTSSNHTQVEVPIDQQECRSDPVSMLSGEEILPLVDFQLSGVLPLIWRRLYRSSKADINLGLGYGWRHNFSLQLVQKYQPPPKVGPKKPGKYSLELTDEEGRVHVFDAVKRGQTSVQLATGWSLYHQGDGRQVLIKPDDSHWTFVKAPEADGEREPCWLLETVSNYHGQHHALFYEQHNGHCRLVRISCSPTRGIVLQYNHDNNLLRIAAYVMDKQGKQQLMPGFLASYQYDDHQGLIAATDSRGQVERYQYGNGHLLTRRTRASGFSHYFQWQTGDEPAKARCIKQWGDDDTYCYHFDYREHADGQLTTSTDSLGNVEQFVHNRRGLLIAHTDPRGKTTTTDYDGAGRKVRESDASGNHTLYRYNDQGQLGEVITPDGGKTRYFYNALGKRILTLDPLGQQYKRRFDGTGRLLSQTGPDGRSEHYSYTDQGQLKQKTAFDGVVSQYHWDDSGELLALQVGERLTRYSYDRLGRLNASIDAQGLVTEFVRNAKGQVIEQLRYDAKQPEHKLSTKFSYDDAGRLIKEQLPGEGESLSGDGGNSTEPDHPYAAGNETRYHYQGLAQPSQKTFADGSYLKYHYDAERNLTSVERSDGERYQIAYSPSEQPVKLTGFDGREQKLDYDDNDKLIAVSDSGERFIRLKRDSMGRIIEQSSAVTQQGHHKGSHSTGNNAGNSAGDGTGHGIANSQAGHLSSNKGKSGGQYHHSNFYRYDLLGRLTRAHNGQRTVQIDYQHQGPGTGQVKQVQQGSWALGYDYNSKGQRASLKLPDGSCVLYEYDQNGQLAQLDYLSKAPTKAPGSGQLNLPHQSQILLQCQYNKAELMTRQTLGNGISLNQEFDVFSRLTGQHWQTAKASGEQGGETGQAFAQNEAGFSEQRLYQYDHQHRLIRCHQQISGSQTTSGANSEEQARKASQQLAEGENSQCHEKIFRYNRLSQLITAREDKQDNHYHWDAFGNPVACSDGESKNQEGSGPAQAQSSNEKAYEASAGVNVHQDRLLSLNGTNYAYDGSGNQIYSLAKGEKQQRTFDGLNQLRQISVNDALTQYEYDALGRRSAKITEQGRTDFIWDNHQLIGEHFKGKFTWYIYQPDSFLPVALIKDGEIYYYHLDQLGTPVCLTDNNTQAVWRNHSDAFGYQQQTQTLNELENPLRFQGQYYDRESGLHYNRFRYYCPRQGRFIHQDPIGLAGGINPYQYAPNPVNWVDPFGLSCKENSWNTFQRNTKGHFANSTEAAQSFRKVKEVQAMEKGTRPDPSTYLPQSYIDAHLAKFIEGATYFVPQWVLAEFGRDPVGRVDGQFVMSSTQVNDMLARTEGSLSEIEKELGIPSGTWQGQEMSVIEVTNPKELNLRLPTGNEEGANPLWLSGGKLPTGYDEAVIDNIPAGEYKELSIEEATEKAKKK